MGGKGERWGATKLISVWIRVWQRYFVTDCRLRFTGFHFQGPRFQGPMSQGRKSQVLGSQFQSRRVPGHTVSGLGFQGPRFWVLGFQTPWFWVSGSRVPGPRVPGPGSQVLILDYAFLGVEISEKLNTSFSFSTFVLWPKSLPFFRSLQCLEFIYILLIWNAYLLELVYFLIFFSRKIWKLEISDIYRLKQHVGLSFQVYFELCKTCTIKQYKY